MERVIDLRMAVSGGTEDDAIKHCACALIAMVSDYESFIAELCCGEYDHVLNEMNGGKLDVTCKR